MTHPVRVALVYGVMLDVGGVERHILSLLQHAQAHGFAYTIYAPCSERFRLQCEQAGAHIITWRLGSLTDIPALLRLRRLLKEEQPALLHIMHPRAYLAPLFWRADTCATVQLRAVDFVKGAGIAARVKRFLYGRVEHFCLRRLMQGVIFVSENARRQARLPHSVTIPNGIPARAADPANRPAHEPGRMVFCAMGRFTYQKGFDLLLRAAAGLQPGSWEVRLLGDGEEAESLRQLAETLGIAAKVRFLGWQDDPSAELQQCDVLVLPSRYEGLPYAALEAMQLGLPVIASASAGLEAVIRHGHSGWIVAAEDVEQLREQMQQVIGLDAEQYRQLCRNAREAALPFGEEAMVGAVFAVYKQLQQAEREQVVLLRSNPVAPDPRVEKTAAVLASCGVAAVVIAWERAGEGQDSHQDTADRIIRLPIRGGYGQGMKNLLPLLRWQIALVCQLLRHAKSARVIHAFDFDTILPALLMKGLFGTRVVYDLCDHYADHIRVRSRLLLAIIRRVDAWCTARADAVILADEQRTAKLGAVRPRRLLFIYNTPEEPAEPLPGQGMVIAPLQVAYVGVLQHDRGLDALLALAARRPEWGFHIAGFGPMAQQIEQEAAALANVRWYGRVPYTAALEIYARASLVYAMYDPAVANNRTASPNKAFEAMLLGKPILAACGTGIDQLVLEHHTGLVCDYGSLEQMEACLEELAADELRQAELGRNARRLYEERYQWRVMRARLTAIYYELLGTTGGSHA